MATYQKRGERWRVQVRLGGSKPLSKTFASKKEATDWAKRVEGRLVDGVIVELRGAADRTTLGEALERYLLEVTPTKKGAKQERGRIRLLSRHHLADRPLSSITSTDIAEYRNNRQAAGKAPTTIRNALTIISQVYEIAQLEWKMSGLVNPVSRIKLPKHRPGRDRRLVAGEEEALLQTCRTLDRPWVEPLVRLAIETAMRQSELLAVEARWIRNCVIQLPDSKTSSPRSVPLSSAALSAFQAMPVPMDRGRFFHL